MRRFISFWVFLAFLIPTSFSQDDDSLLDLLGEEEPTKDFATAGFKTTRIINGHSFEMNAHGIMDFKISHRFGYVSGALQEMFGLDQANIRIGLDYGVTDWLNVGVGRTNVGKFYDGFAKVRVLRQQTGMKNIPIHVLLVSDVAVTSLTEKRLLADEGLTGVFTEYPFSNRLFFTNQLIIGRKFSEGFSMQLMPTMVHRNYVSTNLASNDVFAIGVGGRAKITKRIALNLEYYYVLPDQLNPAIDYKNSLSVGFDIETGGHVFQLHFTNSRGMVENGFITETTGDWLKGDFSFGFNVSRVFTVYRPKRD
ncbi:DUF5777 family beta-barrel protein [Salibacteraceae bacterium]|nr:DUF5777 family beta-barrel protein [Salibacteraceae bacterium]